MMKFVIFITLIFCFSLEISSVPMNNIGYLSQGYNIFKGNPLSKGVDTGFTKPLFDFKYNGRKTSDLRYDVPIGTDILKQSSCSLDFSSDESTTERSYYNKLSHYASVEGGFLGASFSASYEYKRVKDEKVTNKLVHTITTGECIVYKGIVDDYFPPALDQNFKTAILQKLPEEYDNDQYFQFINSYGTHYISEIWMGSRMAEIKSITEKDRNELMSKGVDIKASASFSFLSNLKVSGGYGQDTKKAEMFKSKVAFTELRSIGSPPPKGGDADAWANQVIGEPMPVKYKLMPISELIEAENLDLTGTTTRVQKIKNNMRKALNDYCANLRKQDPSLNCSGPPIEKQQDFKIKNNCALCAQKCGGDYSEDAGTLAFGTTKNSKSFQTFATYCDGEYGSNNIDNEGARLCCMPQTAQKFGSCKLCSTCGGGYDQVSGKVAISLSKDNWAKTADDKCLGQIRQRSQRKDGFNLCCTQNDICSLCTKCGGAFPSETGVLGISEKEKYFVARGDFCEGPLMQGRPYKDGIRLCCAPRARILN